MAGANLQVSDKFVLIGYVIVCVFGQFTILV